MASDDAAVQQLETFERVSAALRRLRELGPVEEILARGPGELAHSSGLDRVLLSRIQGARLLPVAAHFRDDEEGADRALDALRIHPLRLEYPVPEAEMVRVRRATIVPSPTDHPRVDRPVVAPMDGLAYAAAPIVLDARAIGFFHADRLDRPVNELDREALWTFADGFASVFERAVLRRRVREQRRRLHHLVAWTDALAGELSDSAIDLEVDREPDAIGAPVPFLAQASDGSDPSRLEDLLTRRELDVLRLVARGSSNRTIATELVVSEGTVKFHVKNVLRKLRAANRVEATTRYLQLSGPRSREG